MKKEGSTAAHFRKFRVSPGLSRPCDVSLTYALFQVKLKMQRSDPNGPKPAPCPVHAKRHRKERKDKSRVNANHV